MIVRFNNLKFMFTQKIKINRNILQTFSRCIFFNKENTENSTREKLSRTSGFTQLVDFRLTKMRNIFAWKQKDLLPRRKFTTGFTLIEMMVSVSIFAIVVMISMTAILSVVDSNKKAQSLKSVMNNLNFALETMTRSVKTGTSLSVSADNKSISLSDQYSGKYTTYKLNEKRLVRSDGSSEQPITAPEVEIDNLTFIDDLSYAGGTQPSVIMVIQGTVKANERISSKFNIQTTITQRTPGV